MLKKDEFIEFILKGPKTIKQEEEKKPDSALPDGFDGFDIDSHIKTEKKTETGISFAQRLLVASNFGYPAHVHKDNLIRSSDRVAQYLPERVSYWSKTSSRPYQTLLFEANITSKDLLNIPAFKSHKISHLDDVEAVMARMVSEALEGFQKGGEGVTADVRRGRKEETLCVLSVIDQRDLTPVSLVCFGTINAKTNGLETFYLKEQTRLWDQQQARDHLRLLYERQFKKLATSNWQEAFTTSEERKQAENLLEICSKKTISEKEIQEGVLVLLDTIAKGFGLIRKHGQPYRLHAFSLPMNHDIGIDPDELESQHKGRNPFSGVTLRDERNRLLGFFIYPFKTKKDATKLRSYLEKNNRFHNVLVVFPEGEETTLELWQGKDQLTGKLRKGKGFEGAAEVVNLLSRFFIVSNAKVRNPVELAQELAFRARYLRRLALKQLKEEQAAGHLRNLYNAFKESLVHNQTEDEFADAFAQTLTYGLLTSRWIGNNELLETGARFIRQDAYKYMPITSSFLKDLFKSFLSGKYDEQRGRLLWLLDDIADLLDRIDVDFVFGTGDKNSDKATDPVIHFYEPFLAEYDKTLKNQRGVFFTPRPVVSFIVRSIHEYLQKEFGLEDGIASTETWGDVKERFPNLNIPNGISLNDPYVQILDPATGTGTFLYECIEVIENTMKEKWCKELSIKDWSDTAINERWITYVSNHLINRIYGYEIMIASYSIAHLKLAFKLVETGYKLKDIDRLHIYLTNTLEPPSDYPDSQYADLFETLATEAQEVNRVKRDLRFTIIIGNPPYAYSSSNYGEWISELILSYYQVDGKPLGERNPKGLQDDYVKFIRYAQHSIIESGSGIMGYITNHGYLDNPTFPGMRQSLFCDFNQLFFLDLHGNMKKKEKSPDGGKDENVFDIQQGVAIGIFVKLSDLMENNIQHTNIWGERSEKYRSLDSSSSHSIQEKQHITPQTPGYLFCHQALETKDEYDKFIRINKIFEHSANGFKTHRDHVAVSYDQQDISDLVNDLINKKVTDKIIREQYTITDTRDWQLSAARNSMLHDDSWKKRIVKCLYRPLDIRFCLFGRYLMDRPRERELHHALHSNVCLATGRQGQAVGEGEWNLITVGEYVADTNLFYRGGIQYFPLYLYPQQMDLTEASSWPPGLNGRIPNLSINFVNKVEEALGLKFIPEGTTKPKDALSFSPEDVLHYTYSILHSKKYRKRYSDFLKNDYARIPIISDTQLFSQLAFLGHALIDLHLMKSAELDRLITKYIGTPMTEIEKINYSKETVWIDSEKSIGFQGVPADVWSFHIGGYQVCHKWLKDRKGRKLSNDDIIHYQKIIVALSETIRLMKEIDEVIEKHGGWPGAFQTKKEGDA